MTLMTLMRGSYGGGYPSMWTGRRQFGGGALDRAEQFEIIGGRFGRRHEHAQAARRAVRPKWRCAPSRRSRCLARRIAGAGGCGSCAPPARRNAVAARTDLRVRAAAATARTDRAPARSAGLRARDTAATPAAGGSRPASRRARADTRPTASTSVRSASGRRSAAFQRCTGSTYAAGVLSPRRKLRASRARSSGSSSLESNVVTFSGSAASLATQRARVFVRRRDEGRIEVDALGDAARERGGIVDGGFGVGRLAGDPLGIVPQRHAVAAPIQRERPARQRFAGIPFSLPVVQHAAGREAIAQPPDQLVAEGALRRTDRARSSIPRHPCRRSPRRSVRRPS